MYDVCNSKAPALEELKLEISLNFWLRLPLEGYEKWQEIFSLTMSQPI